MSEQRSTESGAPRKRVIFIVPGTHPSHVWVSMLGDCDTAIVNGVEKVVTKVCINCMEVDKFHEAEVECAAQGRVFPAAETRKTCGAGMDGDCFADGCPQRDPGTRQTFCPLPTGNAWVALREHDTPIPPASTEQEATDDHA